METAQKTPTNGKKHLTVKRVKSSSLGVSRTVPVLSKQDKSFFLGIGKSKRFTVASAKTLFLGAGKKD